jgi:plastocyanin
LRHPQANWRVGVISIILQGDLGTIDRDAGVGSGCLAPALMAGGISMFGVDRTIVPFLGKFAWRAFGAGMAVAVSWSAALAADVTVVQKGLAFQPAQITVKTGDNVVFVNQDGFGHNVFSESAGGAFDIGLQQPNQRSSVPFRRDGTFEVQCRIHPKMKLKVTVQN